MQSQLFVAVLALLSVSRGDYVYDVPYEHYYVRSNAARSYSEGGCRVTEWEGMCAVGLFGYQFVSTVDCDDGKTYRMDGINNHGELIAVNVAGEDITFSANDEAADTLAVIGDSVWFSEGTAIALNISGSAYLFGGRPSLTPRRNARGIERAKHAEHTVAYRAYKILEGRRVHDVHIDEGSAYAFDVVFSTDHLVDPPYLMVIDCANDSEIANHFHPWNALYLPLSPGNLYFLSEDGSATLGKATVGFPRWVSASLRYNERVILEQYHSDKVLRVLSALDIDRRKCPNPMLFAVTNFDINSTIGAPVFDEPVSDTFSITPTRRISIVVAH